MLCIVRQRPLPLWIRGQFLWGNVTLKGQQAFQLNPGANSIPRKGFVSSARTGQQHQRQRHFHSHKYCLVCTLCRAPLALPPSFSVNCMFSRESRRAGASPKDSHKQRCPQCKSNTCASWNFASVAARLRSVSINAGPPKYGHGQSRGATRHRQQHTLRDQLPDLTAPLAPIAARIANSRARPVDRARSRFATFAQEISRTNPTAPSISREMA